MAEDHTSADQVALPPPALIRRLLDASEAALVVLDDRWHYVFANRAAADFFHLPAQSLLGRSIRDQYPDIDTTLFGSALRAATASGESRTVVNVRGPDGREFDVSAVPASGHIAIQFRDVTDAKRIAVALRQSEARFRLLAESAPIGVVLCDAGGEIIYANPYVRDVIGRPEAELRGDRWARWVHPEDAARISAEWATFRNGYNASLHQEYRFVRSTGEVRWVRSRVARLLAAERAAIGYVETLEDVTGLRAAAERQRVLAATIEGSSDFVAAADPVGRAFYVNAAGLRLVGVSGLGPVQSMTLVDFVAPLDRERWAMEVLPALQHDGAQRARHSHRRPRVRRARAPRRPGAGDRHGLARHHRESEARGPVPPVAEDGSGRPARRWDCARLQ
jgi:PAS domain S-box-containing protein